MPSHNSFSILFLHLSTICFLWPPLKQTCTYHRMKPTACNKAAGLHNVSTPHPFIARGRTFNKAQTLGQVYKGLELKRVNFYLQLGKAQLYLVPRQNQPEPFWSETYFLQILGHPLKTKVQFTISLRGKDTSTQRYFTLFLGTFYPETFILNSTFLPAQGSNLKEIQKKRRGVKKKKKEGFFL